MVVIRGLDIGGIVAWAGTMLDRPAVPDVTVSLS
jgi:hypothetical protein